MTVHAPSTRRDRRYVLRRGAGIVEIPKAAPQAEVFRASLTRISVAGIAFLIDGPVADFAAGTLLQGARVRVGACVLEGDVAIRDVRPLAGSGAEVGGVFLPASREVEGRLMALLAGIGATIAD